MVQVRRQKGKRGSAKEEHCFILQKGRDWGYRNHCIYLSHYRSMKYTNRVKKYILCYKYPSGFQPHKRPPSHRRALQTVGSYTEQKTGGRCPTEQREGLKEKNCDKPQRLLIPKGNSKMYLEVVFFSFFLFKKTSAKVVCTEKEVGEAGYFRLPRTSTVPHTFFQLFSHSV